MHTMLCFRGFAALAGGVAMTQVSCANYGALGVSLGALTKFCQDYWYPAILAKQLGISSS